MRILLLILLLLSCSTTIYGQKFKDTVEYFEPYRGNGTSYNGRVVYYKDSLQIWRAIIVKGDTANAVTKEQVRRFLFLLNKPELTTTGDTRQW